MIKLKHMVILLFKNDVRQYLFRSTLNDEIETVRLSFIIETVS